MIGLTSRQSEALACIRRYHAVHGAVPSTRTLTLLMGCSSPQCGVNAIRALIERGHLYRDESGVLRLVHEPVPTDWQAKGWRFIDMDGVEEAA